MPFAHHDSVPALEARDTPTMVFFAVRAIEYTVSDPANVFVIVQAVKLVARYAPAALAPTRAVLVLSAHCKFAGGCGGDGGGLGGCGGGAVGAWGGGGGLGGGACGA